MTSKLYGLPDRRQEQMGYAGGAAGPGVAWEWLIRPRRGAGSLFIGGALFRVTELPADPFGRPVVRLTGPGRPALTVGPAGCDCPAGRRWGTCPHAAAVAAAYRALATRRHLWREHGLVDRASRAEG